MYTDTDVSVGQNAISWPAARNRAVTGESPAASFLKLLGRRAVLFLAAAGMLFPFYWMITSALKTKTEIFQFPPTLLPVAANWNIFFETLGEAPFFKYIFNSSFTALAIVLFQIFNSALFPMY